MNENSAPSLLLFEIRLELLSANFPHFWISITSQSIDFSLESSLSMNKNRSTSSVGGLWEIYTPDRTCSELPSPLPGEDKFCKRDRRYAKDNINSCSMTSPSMPTIIRLTQICKSVEQWWVGGFITRSLRGWTDAENSAPVWETPAEGYTCAEKVSHQLDSSNFEVSSTIQLSIVRF